MPRTSQTKDLREAADNGQEIAAHQGHGREAVTVAYRPRRPSDPMPWVGGASVLNTQRFRAMECHARLPLPLPSGTVVECTMDGRRGLFTGPAESQDSVMVAFGNGQPEPVLRADLRKVKD